MDYYVFDSNYTPLGILSSPTSVDYIEKYNGLGTFEVHIPIDENNIALLQTDNVILFDKDRGIAGVIADIDSTQSADSPEITLKGNLNEEMLYRRICWGLFESTGTPQQIIHSMVNANIISPTDANRKIADIVLGVDTLDDQDNLVYQNTGGVVGENIENIASSNAFGFRLVYDPVEKQSILQLYKGTNRTINQRIVPPAIFSSVEYENILSSKYTLATQDMRNVALVAGEGEGLDRKTVQVGTATGKARKEYFVDARDLQSINSDGMSITTEEYTAMLTQRGTEKLSDLRTSQSFDCTINTNGNIRYNEDYFLGDTVTIRDESLQIQLDATISEVEHAVTATGEELYITFGFGPLTFVKKLKVKGV